MYDTLIIMGQLMRAESLIEAYVDKVIEILAILVLEAE